MEWLHKVLSGNPDTNHTLRWASIFVLVWFAMDTAEFIDWAYGKFNPSTSCSMEKP